MGADTISEKDELIMKLQKTISEKDELIMKLQLQITSLTSQHGPQQQQQQQQQLLQQPKPPQHPPAMPPVWWTNYQIPECKYAPEANVSPGSISGVMETLESQ